MSYRNVVCGIIPDVMTLSAEWRHCDVTYRFFLIFKDVLYVQYLYLCNLIIT